MSMKPRKRLAVEALDNDDHDGEEQRFTEAVHKKPKITDTTDDVLQQKIERERVNAENRGIIYIGHLPHGFYEDELRKYFTQFGDVTRVRVSRSRKTGGSRGYAFVEFLHKDVAQVAAETMNGYLMFEKILKVHVVPTEKVHYDMFGPRFPFPLNREITRTFINMERTETREVKNKQSRLQKLNRKMEALKHLGIDYDFAPVGAEGITVPARSSKRTNSTGDSNSDAENGTLLVDSEDEEIEFKTPPHASKKSIKRRDVKTGQKGPSRKKSREIPVSVNLKKNEKKRK